MELGLSGAAGAASLACVLHRRGSQFFGPSIWHGPRNRKQIALTIDDGPSEQTPEFLALLDTLGVRATFFQCGKNIDRLPRIAAQVRDAGHEIGNHTYSHPRLIFCTPARIREEIRDTQAAIRRATGIQARLFRAPYGIRSFGLREALREHGLTGVLWTVMGHDWDWEDIEIAHYVVWHVSNGAIICLHDGDRTSPQVDRNNTILALRQIIPKLYESGYTFVTAGEMLDQIRTGQAAAPAGRATLDAA